MGHGAPTTPWPSFLAQSGAMASRDLWQVRLPGAVACPQATKINTDALPVFGRPWGYLCIDWTYRPSALLLKHGCLSTHSRQFAFPTETLVFCSPGTTGFWRNQAGKMQGLPLRATGPWGCFAGCSGREDYLLI